ncbi:M23 family metallopeptidase [Curtobacterium sp. 1P10AnD]|uniref:M23 family metallopeptidase n=1 Tax=Curtobacterium sp. 1P10AnD TaxID=3132283 RepID=UPI00399F7F97
MSPPAAPVPTVDASIAVCATELPNRRSTRAAEHTVCTAELPNRRSTRAAEHALSTTELPTRRSVRAAEGASRRRPSVRDVTAAVAGALTGAITVPLRALGGVVPTTRVVPLTATTVAACLVVSVASPQSATASTPQVATPAVTLAGQQYVAPAAVAAAIARDAFAVGTAAPASAPRAARPAARSSAPSIVRPVSGVIPTAGGFGARQVAGCGACSTDHRGLDFAAPHGTSVVAVMSGRIIAAGVLGGYGNQVLVQHGDGTRTRYAHLSRIDVVVGQAVGVGQRIGAVGSTGVSTGAHLHFEVVVGGATVDPTPWLSARGVL